LDLRGKVACLTSKHPKRPRDPNQLAKLIVGIASGEVREDKPAPLTPAQEFARSGGLKGGAARAGALSPERRAEIAKRAAEKRWGKR
jgi:hypothetical protein